MPRLDNAYNALHSVEPNAVHGREPDRDFRRVIPPNGRDKNSGDQLNLGAFVYLPAMMPHSVWTKGENTVVQVTGTGPFGLDYINPADDPSKK